MATILKANEVNLFAYSVLFVFWYHSPIFLDASRNCRWQVELVMAAQGLSYMEFDYSYLSQLLYTARSESRCALRLRYVDLVVIIYVAVEVCCCFTIFSC
jgi:hypothetical protein